MAMVYFLHRRHVCRLILWHFPCSAFHWPAHLYNPASPDAVLASGCCLVEKETVNSSCLWGLPSPSLLPPFFFAFLPSWLKLSTVTQVAAARSEVGKSSRRLAEAINLHALSLTNITEPCFLQSNCLIDYCQFSSLNFLGWNLIFKYFLHLKHSF